MMYVRGNAADFDNWANLTNDQGWSYASVLPYFKRAEHNMDITVAWNTGENQ